MYTLLFKYGFFIPVIDVYIFSPSVKSHKIIIMLMGDVSYKTAVSHLHVFKCYLTFNFTLF